MKKEPLIVFPDSSEAASIQTVTGWVSRLGHFFGKDEHLARYDGSTHRKCDCGEIIERNGYCRKCYDRRELEKYDKMERKPWNGKDALYSQVTDGYFFDDCELEDYCGEHDTMPGELRLIICVPSYAAPIDPIEYYRDELPEDRDEVPDSVRAAFQELNDRLEEEKTIISWFPGKYAADFMGGYTKESAGEVQP